MKRRTMRTVTQHIRDRLEDSIGLTPSLEELKKTEWSKDFEKLMRNRLVMGAFRYGLLKNKASHGYDMIGSLKRRIEMYQETGNLEYLVDCANLALLEFEHPTHNKAHFGSVDDGEHCF